MNELEILKEISVTLKALLIPSSLIAASLFVMTVVIAVYVFKD
jgi:hypothetical protein